MKAIFETIRNYYKYETVLPVLTANDSIYGSCAKDYFIGDRPAYMFTSDYLMGGQNNTDGPKFYMTFNPDYYIPANSLCEFNFGCGNGNDNLACYGADGLKITVTYTDDTTRVVYYNSQQATPDFSNNPGQIMTTGKFKTGNKITKSLMVETFLYNYSPYSYFYTTGGWFTINRIVEGTSSDYDFYEDKEIIKLVKEGNNYYAVNL